MTVSVNKKSSKKPIVYKTKGEAIKEISKLVKKGIHEKYIKQLLDDCNNR